MVDEGEAPVQWLDQPLMLVRRSGATEDAPFPAIVDGADDPVVAVDCGHPVLQLGFELLATHILQLVMPPRDSEAWTARLFSPPSRAELEDALLPYRDALLLSGIDKPFLQVKPPRIDEIKRHPVSNLLPDTPSPNAIEKNEDFFVKRGNYGAVHAGLAAPLLYAGTALFPSGGGGYLDIPHKANSLKYQIVGRTLWETLWLNVLDQRSPDLREAQWPAPMDGTVFPWLRDDVRTLHLGRQNDSQKKKRRDAGLAELNTVISVGPGDRHPAGFAMPRRYLLDPPREGRCSVTGREGLVFETFQRWTHGLSYDAQGWTAPYVAPLEKLKADGTSDGRWFSQASAPLRLDDWLSPALDAAGSGGNDTGKTTFVAHPPPVVRALRGRLGTLVDAFEELEDRAEEASAATPELPFRVRVVTQFSFGKAVGGMSEKSLPVYRLREGAHRQLASEAAGLSRTLGSIAWAVRKHAGAAIKLGDPNGKPVLPAQMEDALLREMEGRLLDILPRMASALAGGATADDAFLDLRDALAKEAKDRALALFDAAFPVETVDRMAAQIALIRRRLRHDLYGSPKAGKKTAA
ncbi:type I-E CRISPR-associated protein Cse1/CasA [Caenispirillum salinarum]|uniref:type I-E CRISPR-associated protein Cse1/CasA n=1 Tax=Caenispirillum salinarum TaxID=859058 RepID=UPI00384CD750